MNYNKQKKLMTKNKDFIIHLYLQLQENYYKLEAENKRLDEKNKNLAEVGMEYVMRLSHLLKEKNI